MLLQFLTFISAFIVIGTNTIDSEEIKLDDMNLDILSNIFGHLSVKDVAALKRTSRTMRLPSESLYPKFTKELRQFCDLDYLRQLSRAIINWRSSQFPDRITYRFGVSACMDATKSWMDSNNITISLDIEFILAGGRQTTSFEDRDFSVMKRSGFSYHVVVGEHVIFENERTLATLLASVPNIKSLAYNKQFGDKSVFANELADILKNDRTGFAHLKITIKKTKNVPALLQLLADSLVQNTKLNSLDIDVAEVDDEISRIIANAVIDNNSLTHFSISCESYRGDLFRKGAILASILKHNPRIESFGLNKFSSMYSMEPEDDVMIRTLVDALTDNTSLKRLYLNSNRIGEKGLELLGNLLRTNNNNIRELHLRENNLNECESALELLVMGAFNLEVLDLSLNRMAKPDSMMHISYLIRHSKLKALHLRGNHMDYNAAKILADSLLRHSHLRTLNLDFTLDYLSPEQKGKFLETFKYTRLEYLSLDNYGLRDEHALIIADILKTNHRLKTLKICSSSFTHEIAPSLSEALKMNDNLQVLKMNWNVGLTDPRIERFS